MLYNPDALIGVGSTSLLVERTLSTCTTDQCDVAWTAGTSEAGEVQRVVRNKVSWDGPVRIFDRYADVSHLPGCAVFQCKLGLIDSRGATGR